MTPPGNWISNQTLVLVGMMGAGKTAVGRKLALRLNLPFLDSDTEIVAASDMSIAKYFDTYGEAAFREGERRVIARLLTGTPCVLSTGGGSFIDPETRALIQAKGISIWLQASLDLLVARTSRRDDRPLLRGGNPREQMMSLLAAREPVYGEAKVVVTSDDRPVDETVDRVLLSLKDFAEKANG